MPVCILAQRNQGNMDQLIPIAVKDIPLLEEIKAKEASQEKALQQKDQTEKQIKLEYSSVLKDIVEQERMEALFGFDNIDSIQTTEASSTFSSSIKGIQGEIADLFDQIDGNGTMT